MATFVRILVRSKFHYYSKRLKQIYPFRNYEWCSPARSDTEKAIAEALLITRIMTVPGSRLGVAAFENQDDGALQTIYKANSEPLGGAMVNCQFKNLWDALLGAQKMHDYRQLFPSDWLKMMQDFEANMRTFPHQETKIHLPGSFVSWVNDFRSPSLKRFGEGEVQIIRDEYLCLSSRVMRRLFKPLVEAIKGYLSDTVLNKPRLSKIKTMILVGGLADFPFLQEEIKNMISGRSCVVIPNEAIVAVVRGAVIFGKRAAAAKKRVVGASYGADCSRRFVHIHFFRGRIA